LWRLFEAGPTELRQFIEEEDATVGQADLAGTWPASPTNQTGVTDGVVGSTKRTTGHHGN